MKIELDYDDLKRNYEKKVVRKLSDMKDKYKNPDVKGNPLIYTVYVKDFGTFEVGLTVMEPGTINKEFYMTKGHRHKKARKEIYVLTKGKGKLLVQGAKAQVFNMKKDKLYFIPPKAGHRAINTGKGKMEFLSFYAKDAGHDYNFEFKKRLFRKWI